jgi:hypothetical protein
MLSVIAGSIRMPLDTSAAFWLIISVGGAVLAGVLLAYGLIARRKRRD